MGQHCAVGLQSSGPRIVGDHADAADQEGRELASPSLGQDDGGPPGP